MPIIFCTYYDADPLSVPEITRLENAIGRKLLFFGLSELYDIPCRSSVPGIEVLTGENGKPYLSGHPEICFNITHCRGFVACAFSSSPVGIDAELTECFPEVLIGRALAESEKKLIEACSHDERLRQICFWRLWTLKEAYVKRSGAGVDTDLKAFSFDFDASCAPDIGVPVKIDCSDPAVSCFQILLKSGHVVSLCTGHAPESFVVDVVEKIDLCHDIAEDNNSEHDPYS